MKTKILLSVVSLALTLTGYSKVWEIKNSYYTFTPATLTINAGDSVKFTISNSHDANEVSEATWNAKGNTSLAGGFKTPFGGGLVLPAQLGVGTHFYVCTPHAAGGMIGKIIVQSVTAIDENELLSNISIYPNPATDIITIENNGNFAATSYTITDNTGRQLVSGKLQDVATTVDISYLPVGVYLIILGDKGKQSFKVIKR